MVNAGFESGLASWANWGNAAVVEGAGVSASRALRVGTGAGGVGQDVTGLVPGGQYQLTAQVRMDVPGEVAYLGVNMLDAAGNIVGQKAVEFSGTPFSPASLQFTAPANATRAVVFVWKNAGSGNAYVDNFAYSRTDGNQVPPGSVNIVNNPGFESQLQYWYTFGPVTVVTDAASGAYAVHLGNSTVAQYFSIQPGTRYTVSASGKTGLSGGLVAVSLFFVDASGQESAGADGVFFDTPNWQFKSSDVVVPPGAVSLIVQVYGSIEGYADNISVVGPPPPPGPWDY